VNREADIRQALKLSSKTGIRIAIVGGAEAWRLSDELAAAKVPVFLDALDNLPGSFEQIGASEENAARLHRAGVSVSFINGNDASHNARKVRQIAGVAVSNGLPWEAGLAGITSAPAKALGVDSKIGSIEVGKTADLVLWTGDPLDVASTASAMWLAGKNTPLVSRQTLLRDRYLAPESSLPRAYQP
jgi:imidazolonepropionase-like amidohydrolase